jgi:hypothetical protein
MKYLSGFMADEVKRVRSNRELRLPERYLKPYRAEIWENIGAFLGKSWWTRAWVMQEATALSAKDTYLFYGNASLRMLEVMGTNIALHALEMLQPYGSQTGPTTRQHRIQRMSNIRSFRDEKNGPRPLLEILDQFRGLDATDKRDIVYAALNLSNDIDLNVFRPDYNKSIFEVYRDVAVYYLDHLPYPLDVLAYCGTRTQYLEIPSETASWIPFWDGRMPLSILRKSYTLSDGTSHRTYDASQGYDTLEPSLPSSSKIFQVRGLELILHGFVIDKITSRSSAAITTDTERAIEIVNSWAPMIADMLHFTGETSLDAFLATIATDLAGRKDQYRRGGKAAWKNDRLEIIPENVIYSLMRCLALTENGYMALVSHQAQVGDIIFLLLGGSVLYVLRPKGDHKFWLIGECYVHGLMDGQAMKWLKNGQVSLEEVTVI